jgi:hypothetical protein
VERANMSRLKTILYWQNPAISENMEDGSYFQEHLKETYTPSVHKYKMF